MLTDPPMTRSLGFFSLSPGIGVQVLTCACCMCHSKKHQKKQVSYRIDRNRNVLTLYWKYCHPMLSFFLKDIGCYWLSGVPGDGSSNSGGVMGTKNWIWGETSGGVRGGSPGGFPGWTRRRLREHPRSGAKIWGDCEDRSRDGGT